MRYWLAVLVMAVAGCSVDRSTEQRATDALVIGLHLCAARPGCLVTYDSDGRFDCDCTGVDDFNCAVHNDCGPTPTDAAAP